ncbi:MAG: ATPase, partial [Parasporobacterium sp.]|nr:ATPase [Parasporobacterium sp.]
GILTEAGAKLLDEEGDLSAGSRLCPPEGDAGTGMTATQSVAIGTGNVSCGTSTFAMLVMDKPLSKVYPEIDVVTTPDGRDVAMVHVNNCTSEVNAWAGLFREFAALAGKELSEGEVFDIMYGQAEKAGSEGLLAYNFFSGEPICHIEEGRPMFVRMPDASLTVGGLAKVQLYSAFAGLKIGMDILNGENIAINRITGHGGMFKGSKLPAVVLSAAMGTAVYIREAAGEDGAFGQALLALYQDYASEMDLGTFLSEKIFGNVEFQCFDAPADEKAAFDKYVADLQAGMEAEKIAGSISF